MPKQEKIFYSIKEVAGMFNVNQSLLRFWEKEFSFIKPSKTLKGTRQYKQEDIEAVRLVYHLVKEKGLTLAGAKQKLKENKGDNINVVEIVTHLKNIKIELQALKTEFDEMEKQYNELANRKV
ncbi:MAG: MerR family transcriptional regulator [Dysgonamonadaceae bacterium]|jgi:DNA-binding transcriptional MerR regulator|nr:MerR family transcriptional regulator [Dysgonamonadaceae bacterium]